MSPSADAGFGYEFGGLRISSAFALPGLVPVIGGNPSGFSADIVISLVAEPLPPGQLLHQWVGRYGLALEQAGDVRQIRFGGDCGVVIADAAHRLICHAGPADMELLTDVLVRRLLPRITIFHGRLPLHAATLADGKSATMFFGGSGAGKSTLTAALAHHLRWEILSDDMSVLRDDDRHTAFTVTPSVSLWEASRAALGIPLADCRPLPGYGGKYHYIPPNPVATARPLKAIVLLANPIDDEAIRVTRMEGPEVLVVVSNQRVPFHPGDAQENQSLLTRCKRLVTDVPVFGLAYPRRFDALPRVLDVLQDLLAHA